LRARIVPVLVPLAAVVAALAASSPVAASSNNCTFSGPKYTVGGTTGTLYSLSVGA
jgi:hypothetical protein